MGNPAVMPASAARPQSSGWCRLARETRVPRRPAPAVRDPGVSGGEPPLPLDDRDDVERHPRTDVRPATWNEHTAVNEVRPHNSRCQPPQRVEAEPAQHQPRPGHGISR